MRASPRDTVLRLLHPSPGKQVHCLVNAGMYQVGWFGLVLGGNDLLIFGALLLACHCILSGRKKADLLFLLFFGLSGIVIDGLLRAVGFFSFIDDNAPIPFWLLGIWLLLATLPGHALSWLQGRTVLNVVFGAVAGPVAYIGGQKLGAAVMHWPGIYAVLVLAVVWGIFWPLAMHCASKVYASPEEDTLQNQSST